MCNTRLTCKELYCVEPQMWEARTGTSRGTGLYLPYIHQPASQALQLHAILQQVQFSYRFSMTDVYTIKLIEFITDLHLFPFYTEIYTSMCLWKYPFSRTIKFLMAKRRCGINIYYIGPKCTCKHCQYSRFFIILIIKSDLQTLLITFCSYMNSVYLFVF